jgi:glycosyltransferase involved in cell wall biosynthesis
MKISYAITVYNELEEIKRLVSFLLLHKSKQDEIVILFDSKGTKEVRDYLIKIEEKITLLHKEKFNNDFGQWKNLLSKLCSGDYIFQIDADELPTEDLINNLPYILEINPEVDVFLVPRINTVEGLTQQHIRQWRWNVNGKGWVNFPDYQWRIYKNHSGIKWKNKVHEVLEGFKTSTLLPAEEEYCLYHPKTIDRQERQNNYYDTL